MRVGGGTFLVTGATSGLGRGCARALVDAGASVCLVGRDIERGREVEAELGERAFFRAADICSEAGVSGAIAACERLDGVIHCAGVASSQRLVGKAGVLELESIEETIRVNVVGTLNVVRLTAERMSRNPADDEGERGAIVLTSSIAAMDGQVGQAVYAASKGAVNALALPLAREFARFGIRVNAIAAGLFETPMLAGFNREMLDRVVETAPYPSRMGYPAEFAALAIHLLENRMLNGEVIRLDGGLRLAHR